MKKLFGLIVVFSLIAVIFVLPVMADEATVNNSCGNGVVWSYDEKSDTLTISGNGAMYDYGIDIKKPWYEYELTLSGFIKEPLFMRVHCTVRNHTKLKGLEINIDEAMIEEYNDEEN